MFRPYVSVSELSMGWADPRVGLGWVGSVVRLLSPRTNSGGATPGRSRSDKLAGRSIALALPDLRIALLS